MAVVDGRKPNRAMPLHSDEQVRAAGAGVLVDLLATMPKREVTHDYPACAVFRGGKCTCDQPTTAIGAAP